VYLLLTYRTEKARRAAKGMKVNDALLKQKNWKKKKKSRDTSKKLRTQRTRKDCSVNLGESRRKTPTPATVKVKRAKNDCKGGRGGGVGITEIITASLKKEEKIVGAGITHGVLNYASGDGVSEDGWDRLVSKARV